MYSQFKVIKYKEKGYVALESVANKGVFIGMTPDGKVRPTVDTGEKNVRLYPEVIQCKLKPWMYCEVKEVYSISSNTQN